MSTKCDILKFKGFIMNVKELYDICKNAIEDDKGDSRVMFDTCAQSFDVHRVEVSSAGIEPLMEDDLILDFEMKRGVCHTERNNESIENSEAIKKCPSCGVELYKTSPPYIEGFCGKCYSKK